MFEGLMGKSRSARLLIAVMALIVSSCTATTTETTTSTTDSTQTSDSSTTSPPGEGDDAASSVRVAVTSFQQEQIAKWMAPKATLAYIGPMFDPPVAPAADGSPTRDGIISDWQLDLESNVLTLSVRQGVLFHNGDEVTADDIKFSLEVASDPASSSTSGGQLRSSINEIEVTDTYQLELQLNGPQPTLINLLSWVEGDVVVLPKNYLEGLSGETLEEKAESFSAAPIGTGPWKYQSHTLGQSIEFLANDAYYDPDRVPEFEQLTLLSVGEPTTRENMLRAGEVDVIDSLADQAGRLQEDGFQPYLVRNVAHAIVSFLKSYDDSFLTNDQRVREALTLAIDREALVSTLFPELPGVGSAATVSNGPALSGPGIAGFEESFEAYPYDPDRAMELLEEVGYYDSPEQVLAWQYAVSELPTGPELMEGVAAYWEAIGVEVELRPTDPGALIEKLQAEDPPLEANDVVTWPPSYRPSGLNNLRVFASSKEIGNLMASPIPFEVDELVLEVSAIPDPDEFNSAMTALWERLHEANWAIPLAWVSKTVVVDPATVADYSPLDLQGDFAAWETLKPAQ